MVIYRGGVTMLNFSWVEEGQLAGSARPGWMGDLATDLLLLHTAGVRAIVGFLEPGTTLDYTAHPAVTFETLVLEVEDHTAPPLEAIERGLAFIDDCLARGQPVVVHCLAGIGRTGTLLACYLARAHGLDGEAAIQRLRAVRPLSLETPAQAALVRQFAGR